FLEPRHAHLAIRGDGGREMFACLFVLARPLVQTAEPTVAMRNERTHAARFGQRQRLAIVRFDERRVESVGMMRDVAQQMQSESREPRVMYRRRDRTLAKPLRLIELAKR